MDPPAGGRQKPAAIPERTPPKHPPLTTRPSRHIISSAPPAQPRTGPISPANQRSQLAGGRQPDMVVTSGEVLVPRPVYADRTIRTSHRPPSGHACKRHNRTTATSRHHVATPQTRPLLRPRPTSVSVPAPTGPMSMVGAPAPRIGMTCGCRKPLPPGQIRGETPPLGACARWPVGRSAPGCACDDLRLVGLKLIFLIVTRACRCWACPAGGVGEGRRDLDPAPPAGCRPARGAAGSCEADVAGSGVAGAAGQDTAGRAPRRAAAHRHSQLHLAVAP